MSRASDQTKIEETVTPPQKSDVTVTSFGTHAPPATHTQSTAETQTACIDLCQTNASAQSGADATELFPIRVGKLIDRIKTGTITESLIEDITEIRRIYSEVLMKSQAEGKSIGDARKLAKEAISEKKKKLLAVTFSGIFSPYRRRNCLKKYTRILCLDLDHLGIALAVVRQQISTDPHTLVVFLSPSGDGLKVLVWVEADAELHLAAFLTIEKYYLENLGLEIDPSGKDPTRLCFVSYDPELFYNPRALPFVPDLSLIDKPNPTVEKPAKTEILVAEGSKKNVEKNERDQPSIHKVRRALYYIDPATLEYDEWCINVGAALHNWSEGEDYGLDLWHEWSQADSRYEAEALEASWRCFGNSPREKPVTIASLFAVAKGFGWKAYEPPSEWFALEFPGLEEKYGKAFLEVWEEYQYTNAEGKKVKSRRLHVNGLNEDFLAATVGGEGSAAEPVVFSSLEKTFFQFDPNAGFYVRRESRALEAQISQRLLACARECRSGAVDTTPLQFKFRSTRCLQAVAQRAQGLLAVGDDFFERPKGLIPCQNGILRLSDRTLLRFSPKYHFRGKLGVKYDPNATCPTWLAVLQRALPDDDIELLQRWAGQMIIGKNLTQKMVLLSGTTQSSKGTIVRVFVGLCGAENVATLRTEQLNGRFESARLRHKVLIYGADVPANFLNVRGAEMLKAITGGDPDSPEYKGSNDTPPVKPIRANVLLTSNSRLKIRLEGDTEAWRRRLVIIPFEGEPVPEDQVVTNLSDSLLLNEGSGILNWVLEGLARFNRDEQRLFLNERQQKIRDALLSESESYRQWAVERLELSEGARLTVNDAYSDFVEFCTTHDFAPLPRRKFGTVIKDTVVQIHGLATRNDIRDGLGGCKEGWRGLAIVGQERREAGLDEP